MRTKDDIAATIAVIILAGLLFYGLYVNSKHETKDPAKKVNEVESSTANGN